MNLRQPTSAAIATLLMTPIVALAFPQTASAALRDEAASQVVQTADRARTGTIKLSITAPEGVPGQITIVGASPKNRKFRQVATKPAGDDSTSYKSRLRVPAGKYRVLTSSVSYLGRDYSSRVATKPVFAVRSDKSVAAKIVISPVPVALEVDVAEIDSSSISLRWRRADSTAESTFMVRKGVTDQPPASVTDGSLLYEGTGLRVTDANLTPGSVHSYSVWLKVGNAYEGPVSYTASTPDLAPTGESAEPAYAALGSTILLSSAEAANRLVALPNGGVALRAAPGEALSVGQGVGAEPNTVAPGGLAARIYSVSPDGKTAILEAGTLPDLFSYFDVEYEQAQQRRLSPSGSARRDIPFPDLDCVGGTNSTVRIAKFDPFAEKRLFEYGFKTQWGVPYGAQLDFDFAFGAKLGIDFDVSGGVTCSKELGEPIDIPITKTPVPLDLSIQFVAEASAATSFTGTFALRPGLSFASRVETVGTVPIPRVPTITPFVDEFTFPAADSSGVKVGAAVGADVTVGPKFEFDGPAGADASFQAGIEVRTRFVDAKLAAIAYPEPLEDGSTFCKSFDVGMTADGGVALDVLFPGFELNQYVSFLAEPTSRTFFEKSSPEGCTNPKIRDDVLPSGTRTRDYNFQLDSLDGRDGFWSASAGQTEIPPGLSLSERGLLSGTPSEVGDFEFNVTFDDGEKTVTAPVKLLVLEVPDPDTDFLVTLAELILGTDPNVGDTDGDGLLDGIEYVVHKTDPLVSDTDGDGVSDGDEVRLETDPLDPNDPGAPEEPEEPEEPQPATAWKMVVGGGSAICALRGDGVAFCWGQGSSGSLGNGDPDLAQSRDPVEVLNPNPSGATWTSISRGGNAACGLQSDKTIWCWGGARFLGIGITSVMYDARATPVQVGKGTDWKSVTMTEGGTGCGIAVDGSLWCWGNNFAGAAGQPKTTEWIGSPTRVGSATDWKSIDGGYYHTCGLRTDKTLWCWGDDARGQLAVDERTNNGSHEPRRMLDGATWRSVASGFEHVCGLKTDASLWCWGDDANDVHANGPSVKTTLPTQVGTSEWSTVASGDGFACANDLAKALWCWGDNSAGQAGVGYQSPSDVPSTHLHEPTRTATPVGGDPSVIVKGPMATFAGVGLGSATGFPYCWGQGGCYRVTKFATPFLYTTDGS